MARISIGKSMSHIFVGDVPGKWWFISNFLLGATKTMPPRRDFEVKRFLKVLPLFER